MPKGYNRKGKGKLSLKPSKHVLKEGKESQVESKP